MIVLTANVVWLGRTSATPVEKEAFDEIATASFGRTGSSTLIFNIGAILIRVGLLAASSTALVRGAVGVASSFGVSDAVIGLTRLDGIDGVRSTARWGGQGTWGG